MPDHLGSYVPLRDLLIEQASDAWQSSADLGIPDRVARSVIVSLGADRRLEIEKRDGVYLFRLPRD